MKDIDHYVHSGRLRSAAQLIATVRHHIDDDDEDMERMLDKASAICDFEAHKLEEKGKLWNSHTNRKPA